MNQFKKTKQIFALVTVLLVVSIVMYVIFFINIKEKNKNISSIVSEIDLVVKKEVRLKSVKNLIKETEGDHIKLNTYFITDDKVVDFIENIENMAKDVGVDIEVVSVYVNDIKDDSIQKNNISELLRLSIEMSGKWSNIYHFVSLVEKLPFKIDILNINLENMYNGDNENPENWKGVLNLSAVKLKKKVNSF